MGFTSFAGRVLFSAIFIFTAYQKITDFGSYGGNYGKSLEPKISALKVQATSSFGIIIPEFEIKYVVMASIILEGLGGVLFTLGSNFGAYFLLLFLVIFKPIENDFYKYDLSDPAYAREFIQFLKNLSLFGALLFFLGMKNYALKKSKKKLVKTKAN